MDVKSDRCVCDNCYNRHLNSVSTHWCSFCSESLCSLCTEHHQGSKLLKSHLLIPISDYQKLPFYVKDFKNYCNIHEEPFQLYCQTHGQCCCVFCIKETHNGCKDIESLNEVVKDVKSSPALEDIELCLKNILSFYDNIRKNRFENESRLAEQKEKIMADIQTIRKSINDHFDNLVHLIEKSVLTEFEAASLKIKKVISQVENRQKNIRQLIEEEELIRVLSTDVQTFLGLPFFQCRIKEETEYIENMQREHQADELDFIFHSNKLDTICRENCSFGTVSVSQGECLIDFDFEKKETAQIILTKNGVCDKHASNIQQIKYPERDSAIKISGCAILPSGQFIFVDNGKLVLSNGENNCKEISLSGIWDVTLIGTTKAAVTITNSKTVVIVDLLTEKRIKMFSLDDKCWGIEFNNEHFVIKSSEGFLIIDAQSGDVVTTIKNNCLTNVTANNDKIFSCRHKDNTVNCFHVDGDELWKFEDEMLKYPCDLTTDERGFVYVTGKESNNVIVISPDGKTCKEILKGSDGLNAPMAIHYEKNLGQLLVCNEKNGAVIVNIS